MVPGRQPVNVEDGGDEVRVERGRWSVTTKRREMEITACEKIISGKGGVRDRFD